MIARLIENDLTTDDFATFLVICFAVIVLIMLLLRR